MQQAMHESGSSCNYCLGGISDRCLSYSAQPGFSGDHIIYAKDPNFVGTTNFYIGMKNVVLDSTALNSSLSIALLDWGVSQATQLSNVAFNMPTSSAHVGLTTQYDYNSNVIMVSFLDLHENKC